MMFRIFFFFIFYRYLMKEFLKKLFAYDKWYNEFKDNLLYQSYKKYRAKFYNFLSENPSKEMFVIGVTGTNGKTTVVNLLHKILNENIAPTVAISTACIKVGNQLLPNTKGMTSPDVVDLQNILATARASGCKIAVLEVSSQGLDQFRFEGIKFDFAVLTNITQDHLDYHGDMDHYAEAKRKLFKYVLQNGKENKYAAFCTDDSYGKKWFEEMAFDKKISFSINNSSVLKATLIDESFEGTYFEFSYLGQRYTATTYLTGAYNICNILGALATVTEMGLELPLAIKSVENFGGISGRMEPVYAENGVRYYIDFAHTPDGLDKILTFAQHAKGKGRVILVCGAPGNRDKDKRHQMGNIALQNSDVTIFTDDDPSTENRLKILNDMVKDFNSDAVLWNEFFIIPERQYAMKFATEIAQSGDIVIFAGRGHEKTQSTNFGPREFDDKAELLNLLKEQKVWLSNVAEIKNRYLQEIRKRHQVQQPVQQQTFQQMMQQTVSTQPTGMFGIPH